MATQKTTELIYFFRESQRKSTWEMNPTWLKYIAPADQLLFFRGQARGWAVMGLTLVSAVILARFLGLDPRTSTVAVLFTLGPIAIATIAVGSKQGWYASRRDWKEQRSLPSEQPGERARLACVGLRRRLEEFGELADVAFEPVLFSSTAAPLSSNAMRATAVSLATAAAIAAHCLFKVVRGSSLPSWDYIAFVVCGSLTFASLATGWLWPRYFRIVPGRLDVMRFNNLLNRPTAVERYNLRRARILVDLPRGVVFIDDEDGRRAEIAMWQIWFFASPRREYRFAYHLFLGALSTHEPPDLPDDKLLS